MPRLLLVARNPGLAFGLASASDDIIEVRPSLVGRLAVSPGMADVVVIEQERPDDALATLDTIRAGGLMAPALLVASARPEWGDFDPGSRPSVSVLDPPITQDRLGQSIGSTSELPDADLVRPAAAPDTELAQELEAEAVPDPVEQPQPLEPLDVPTEPSVPDHVDLIFSDALTQGGPLVVDAVATLPTVDDDDTEPPDHVETLDDDLPIAAAAADARAEESLDPPPEAPEPVEDEAALPQAEPAEVLDLPDGPEDLEPPDDPYATATHVPLAVEDEPEPEPQGFETVAETEVETEVVGSTEPASDEVSAENTADGDADAEPDIEPEISEQDLALAAVVAAAVAEAGPADDVADAEPEAAADSDAHADDLADADLADHVEAGLTSEPATPSVEDEIVDAPDAGGDAEVGDTEVGDTEVGGERVLDTGMLAIPSAAPMRQPEEIRLGTVGRDVLPAVVLYDEEDDLTVAEGTPSPAAWLAEPTEPVVAWQGPNAAKDARVYAEMASLVAASGELLADEPEVDEQPDDSDEDVPSIDLSQVFADPAERAAAMATTTVLTDDVLTDDEPAQDEPAPDEPADDAVLVGTVTDEHTPIEVVDLRDQLVDDPRSTSSLVRALLSRSHEVYGVSEAGALVVADALARTGASAGALLLPDGDSWRVAAGEGLRRLEHRYVLGSDSWLVTTIASRHKGLIIDRTDVARRPLAGAPLAAHKHLVAAPVRAVAGILLIARDDEPAFGERDLLSLARLAEASSGILASALDARQLARLLGDIRDQDDRAAADRIDYGV